MFAGSGTQGSSNGLGTKASFCGPDGITLDQQTGTLYISDRDCYNDFIRKITPEGMLIFRFNITAQQHENISKHDSDINAVIR